jgi:hypothetical protein
MPSKSLSPLIAILLACAFCQFQPARADEPARPAAKIKADLYALMVDGRYLQNPGISKELARYKANVEKTFGVRLLQVSGNSLSTPEQTRTRLQTLHEQQGIKGVFLIGWFKFARFQNASGDLCTLPEFFEDLDGNFEDADGDGIYDVYDPWQGTADEEATGGLDIWVATLRPYFNTTEDFRSANDITTYFAKVNDDLEGKNLGVYQKRAQIFTSYDWPDQKALQDSLGTLYDEPTSLTGGFDPQTHEALRTSVSQFGQTVARPDEMTFVFAHSGPSQHICDLPAYPGNLILPGVLDYPGRALLEDMQINTKMLLLWGCHTLDIEGVDYMNDRSLQDSYLLTPQNKVLTLVGNSKSIGLEDLPFLVRSLKSQPLAAVWLPYLNHVYSKPFLHPWLGSRNAWDKERGHFNWGYIICGNPFTKVG